MELKDIVLNYCTCYIYGKENFNFSLPRNWITYFSWRAKPESNEPFWYNSQQVFLDSELFRRNKADNFFRFGKFFSLHAQQFCGITNVGIFRGHVIMYHSSNITYANKYKYSKNKTSLSTKFKNKVSFVLSSTMMSKSPLCSCSPRKLTVAW